MKKENEKIRLEKITVVMILLLIFSIETTAAPNDVLSSEAIDDNSSTYFAKTGMDIATSSEAKERNDRGIPNVAVVGDAVSRALTDKSVISMRYPVTDRVEGSPFDFLLDPYGLVHKTEAMRYGEGCVEEGATLLFYNRDGEYDFSKESDKLMVLTQEPVEITITAYLSGVEGLAVMEDRNFLERDVCGMYLALVDDRGNEQPLSADGEVSISLSLESGSYSFGLIGACNSDADWQELSIQPKVTVTWCVEPLRNGEDFFFVEEGGEEEREENEKATKAFLDEGEKNQRQKGIT